MNRQIMFIKKYKTPDRNTRIDTILSQNIQKVGQRTHERQRHSQNIQNAGQKHANRQTFTKHSERRTENTRIDES